MPAFFLILACALWGLSFPVVKVLHLEQEARLPGGSSWFLAAWLQVARFGLGAALLLPLALRVGRPSGPELRQGLWLALWGGLGMGVQAEALAHTEASTSAFLTQAYCVFLPLWACLRDRRPPTRRVVAATSMVLVGGAILSGLRPGELRIGRGEAMTLVAAFFFTFQILTLEMPRYERNRGLPVTMVMCVGIAVLFLPVAWAFAPAPGAMIEAGASWSSLLLVGVLALCCTVGAFLLMNVWQPRMPATEAGLIYTTEPVFAASYAMFLPALLALVTGVAYANERASATLLTGGGLIVVANVVMQWKQRPRPPAVAPAP